MKPDPSKNLTPSTTTIASRMQRLERVVVEDERGSSRRRRIYLSAGVALTAVCCIWLSYLTNAAFKLDAHALTQIGRLEVEKQLPSGIEGLREYLKIQAPNLVYYLLRSSFDVVPKLRAAFTMEIDERTHGLIHGYESEFFTSMEGAIQASKQNIDLMASDRSDSEKLELLVDKSARDFQEGIRAALHELYPAYAAELNRIDGFLVNLQHKDESLLSDREVLQKEIIETLLHLIAQEGLKDR